MLVGNKLDLVDSMPEQRKITVEEAKKFCVEKDIFMVENAVLKQCLKKN